MVCPKHTTKRPKKRNNADAKRHDLEQQLEKASGLREGAAAPWSDGNHWGMRKLFTHEIM